MLVLKCKAAILSIAKSALPAVKKMVSSALKNGCVVKIINHNRARNGYHLLLCFFILVPGCTTHKSHEQPLPALVPLPTIHDQTVIIMQSKQYTDDWIKGDTQRCFPLLSGDTFYSDKNHIQSWVRFLSRQRLKRTDIHVTAEPQSVRCIPASYYTIGKVLVATLSSNSSASKNKMGQYDAGMHLVKSDAAMVQFSLSHKTYYQVWIRNTDNKWKCVHFPLDLDQQTLKQFEQWK